MTRGFAAASRKKKTHQTLVGRALQDHCAVHISTFCPHALFACARAHYDPFCVELEKERDRERGSAFLSQSAKALKQPRETWIYLRFKSWPQTLQVARTGSWSGEFVYKYMYMEEGGCLVGCLRLCMHCAKGADIFCVYACRSYNHQTCVYTKMPRKWGKRVLCFVRRNEAIQELDAFWYLQSLGKA